MLPGLFVRNFTPVVCVFVIVAITVLAISKAHAQVAGATLTGTVKDASGGIIPNAQLTITDVATAVSRVGAERPGERRERARIAAHSAMQTGRPGN